MSRVSSRGKQSTKAQMKISQSVQALLRPLKMLNMSISFKTFFFFFNSSMLDLDTKQPDFNRLGPKYHYISMPLFCLK